MIASFKPTQRQCEDYRLVVGCLLEWQKWFDKKNKKRGRGIRHCRHTTNSSSRVYDLADQRGTEKDLKPIRSVFDVSGGDISWRENMWDNVIREWEDDLSTIG